MKNKKKIFYFLIGLVILGVLRDVFLVKISSDISTFYLLVAWILIISLGHFLKESSLIMGLIFLILSSLLIGLGGNSFAEKSAVWAYLFFLVGVINVFISDSQNDRKK